VYIFVSQCYAYQRYGNHETPESSGEKGDHLVGEYYVRFEQELQKQLRELINSGLSGGRSEKTGSAEFGDP
jgi:arginyl-tRNA synthetase